MQVSLSRHALVAIGFLLAAAQATAAYQRLSTGPVRVVNVYANEFGSPFVLFDTDIHSACTGARGLYLYNLETAANNQLRNNKMALVLTALTTNRTVVLDYFVDPARVGGWDACYIHGITMN